MNPEDVPEQVTYAALAAYLGRAGGVLLAEDFGAFARMAATVATVLAHPDAENARAQAAYSRGVEEGQRRQAATDARARRVFEATSPAPGDLRIDPDMRVDAAYQRGFVAGRATVTATEVIESELGTVVDEEVRAATLATLAAQKRHAEVAAETSLEQADLARQAFDSIQDSTKAEREDRARRWDAAQAADAERITPAYVIRRDAIFAAISHADARCRAAASIDAVEDTTREKIMAAVPWWTAQLTVPEPLPTVPVESAHAAVFADQLIGAAGGFETVDSIHDSTTPGGFRVILTDETILDVSVSEAPPVA